MQLKKNIVSFYVNILAVGQENYPQALDDFSFDEDSSDALSPDQPASQESQGSAASPGEPKPSDSPSPITPNAATSTQVQFLNVKIFPVRFLVWHCRSGACIQTEWIHLLLQRAVWDSLFCLGVSGVEPWLSWWQWWNSHRLQWSHKFPEIHYDKICSFPRSCLKGHGHGLLQLLLIT